MNSKIASQDYLDYLLKGNRKNANQICNAYLNNSGTIKDLYELVMKPALYEVGNLWEQNKISVASEHLATAITEGILNTYYPYIIPEKYNGKKVVLACVNKEEHQVGIKMAADIFEMNHWESHFLGSGFPTSELIKYIKETQPNLIAISLSVYYNYIAFMQMIIDLKTAYPDIPIIAGGQAISHFADSSFDEWNDITFITDLNQLEDYIIQSK